MLPLTFEIIFDYRSIFVHRNVVDIVSHFLFKELQKVLKGRSLSLLKLKSTDTTESDTVKTREIRKRRQLSQWICEKHINAAAKI